MYPPTHLVRNVANNYYSEYGGKGSPLCDTTIVYTREGESWDGLLTRIQWGWGSTRNLGIYICAAVVVQNTLQKFSEAKLECVVLDSLVVYPPTHLVRNVLFRITEVRAHLCAIQ